MKIPIDMNLSPLWVQFLVGSGFDSIHCSNIGPSAAPDTQIMDEAKTLWGNLPSCGRLSIGPTQRVPRAFAAGRRR